MTTLTIEIKDTDQKKLVDFVNGLGRKIVQSVSEKKLSKASKKQQILDDFESSMEFVKLHQAGKVKAKSIDQLLSEL